MVTLQKDRVIREQLSDFSTLVPDDELSPVLRFLLLACLAPEAYQRPESRKSLSASESRLSI